MKSNKKPASSGQTVKGLSRTKISIGNPPVIPVNQVHRQQIGTLVPADPGRLLDPTPTNPNVIAGYMPTQYDTILAAIQGYYEFISAIGCDATLRRYVLVFAHGHLFGDSPRHALLIRKPADSPLHPGLLNLPGGHIEHGEHPKDTAVREFYEETGWQCHQPQLLGVLLPSQFDFMTVTPYIVYCYRCIIDTAQSQTAVDDAHEANVKQHDLKWHLISDLDIKQTVPSVPCILAHFASETRCWVIQDCCTVPARELEERHLSRCSQQIISYYPSDRTLEAQMGVKANRRINDA